MANDEPRPEEDDQPPEPSRMFGLLVSEWVTYGLIVAVVVAVFFGIRVGGERDNQVERAMATLEALREEAERVVAAGGTLYCDDSLLDAERLENDYLSLSVRPAPIDEKDESQGYGPALYVSVVEKEVSGDTWDTAQRLMAFVKKQAKEQQEAEASEERSPTAEKETAADESAADAEAGEDDEPESPLRKVRKTGFEEDEEYLRYYILASETALCSQEG